MNQKSRCLLCSQSKTPDFCRTLIKPIGFSFFSMHFLLKTDGSLSVHFGSWHAVYSDYIPDTAKESPVLPAFSPSVGIFGIHNHFSYAKGSFYPGSSGSSDTGSLFRSGYFHRISGVFPKSSSINTASCFLWPSCISLYTGSRCSLRIHIPLLPIDTRFWLFAFFTATTFNLFSA